MEKDRKVYKLGGAFHVLYNLLKGGLEEGCWLGEFKPTALSDLKSIEYCTIKNGQGSGVGEVVLVGYRV